MKVGATSDLYTSHQAEAGMAKLKVDLVVLQTILPALPTPSTVGCDSDFSTRVCLRVVDVKLKWFTFVGFYQCKQIL